jgi:TolB-like protein/class 3 adenylate cyclase/Tfp pilus assembly protein PilF
MERRLAAVLIADVVGYVRLSQSDEEGTRARFQVDLHEVFEPAITAHRGRLVKTMGDSLLVEFHSVVDAERCAVELQRSKAERNAGVPGDKRLVYRIGINLGDVIVEGDDIHGDGVNIADRLQVLADPGGIAISGTAYDHVKTKVDVGYDYLGEQWVKHVAEPVRVYRVLLDPKERGKAIGIAEKTRGHWRWPAAAAALVAVLAAGAGAWWRPWEPAMEPASVEHMALPLPDKPSIAVLPFTNMSGDPKQEAFADGMTDDLITELSKVSGLFVISRNSTFMYKGKTVPPKQVSEELGVRYVLEGSVQRAGDRLRINAQLIDALSGGHAWADKFDGSFADVFALQDKVTLSIADALAVRLTNAEQTALNEKETSVPSAYEAFLRGWEQYRRTTPDAYAEAIPHFEEAVRLDPSYGRAHAALAMAYIILNDRGWWVALGMPSAEIAGRIEDHIQAAMAHPTSTYYQARANFIRTSGYSLINVQFLRKAIALDPSDSWSYAYIAWALVDVAQPAEGLVYIKTAMRLDPHYPPVFLYILGLTQFAQQQFPDAAASFERATNLNIEDEYPFLALAATYGHLGRKVEAQVAVTRYNELRVSRGDIPLTIATAPSLSFTRYMSEPLLKKGLRLAGVPEALRGSEFAAKNQLTSAEIRGLFFGKRLHGRSLVSGDEHDAAFSADGSVTMSGDWGELSNASTNFAGNDMCFQAIGGVNFCAQIVRNPGAPKLQENEFVWIDRTGAYPFSAIE